MSTTDPVCPADLRPATAQIHAGREQLDPYRPVAVPIHQTAAYEFPDYATARRMFALKEPGIHLHPHRQPDRRHPGAPAGGPRRRRGRGRHRHRAGRRRAGPAGPAPGREPHRGLRQALRRHRGPAHGHLRATSASRSRFVDPALPEQWAAAATPGTRAFLTESIGNPLSTLPDLSALAAAAHAPAFRWWSTTPWPRPCCAGRWTSGADIVVYSATKYLGGHGTTLAGAVVDGGRFDFSAEPGKWPQLARPKARYGNDIPVGAARARRLPGPAAQQVPARPGPVAVPGRRGADPPGPGDPGPARGPPHRLGAARGPPPGRAPGGCRRAPPGHRGGPEREDRGPGLPARHRRGLLLRPRAAGGHGRVGGGGHVHRLPAAGQAGRQHRRRPLARGAPGRDDPLPAHPRAARRGRDLRDHDPALDRAGGSRGHRRRPGPGAGRPGRGAARRRPRRRRSGAPARPGKAA